MRGVIMIMVYNKALKISLDSTPPSGKVLTLLTSDVSTLSLNIPILFQYIMTPLQLIGTPIPLPSLFLILSPLSLFFT